MKNKLTRPRHYTYLKPEPRLVLEAWSYKIGYYRSTAIKYIVRAGKKENAKVDIEKAIQYLKFYLEDLENDNQNPKSKA
jgi:Protein of unknwon function (DUF3310)